MELTLDGLKQYERLPGTSRSWQYFGFILLPQKKEKAAWLEISHAQDSSSSIVCRLAYPDRLQGSNFVPFGDDRELRFRITNPSVGTITLFEIEAGTFSGQEAKFVCRKYDLCASNLADAPTEIAAFCARLTSEGLLKFDRIPLGYRNSVARTWNEPSLSWDREGIQLKIGIEAIDKGIRYGPNVGLLSYQQACVRGKFRIDPARSAQGILDELDEWLEYPLLLLGLLSRELVNVFELTVELGSHALGNFDFTRRVDPPLLDEVEKSEKPLHSVRELDSGDFSSMLKRLENHERRDDLARSIRYHLASYRHETLDTKFILAIAALETLVNLLDAQAPTLEDSAVDWKELLRKLEIEVQNYGNASGLESKTVASLKQRVQSLQRVPFSKKATFQIARLQVETDWLWQNHKSAKDEFEKGLSEAYGRRSALVHNTVIKDGDRMVSDLARIQNLFERMVMRILGGRMPNSSDALATAHYAAGVSESGL